MTRSDITFLDTETLGLHRRAPIWEFAAIRRTYHDSGGYTETPYHCFIKHRRNPWLSHLPDSFKDDYLKRFSTAETVFSKWAAIKLIVEATHQAHIVGAVPNFDTERIERMMLRRRIEPSWHYHLIDVENLVLGYLRGKFPNAAHQPLQHAQHLALTPPWKSDTLSSAIGVDPANYNRHTAMGDVEWVRDQYNVVMGEA